MDLRPRRLAPDQVEGAHAILVACGEDMATRLGLTHWRPPYPLACMRDEAAERTVVLVECDGRSLATYTLGTTALADYPPALWAPGPVRAAYLNRLAVEPAHQGHGIGTWCMARVEEWAADAGCDALRFDVIAHHDRLRRFYRRLGYEERGHFAHWGWDVVCCEKVLGGCATRAS